jgi:ribosomal protein L12E/L44/L45/RPP1/RPP2
MTSYQVLITEDRRLVILRALLEDAGYSHNESVLQSILAAFGHTVSRDQVRNLVSWLKEQELVHVEMVGDYMVAKLTGRGADVASGAATVPGVKRPAPRG